MTDEIFKKAVELIKKQNKISSTINFLMNALNYDFAELDKIGLFYNNGKTLHCNGSFVIDEQFKNEFRASIKNLLNRYEKETKRLESEFREL